jgi:hypothetical protein
MNRDLKRTPAAWITLSLVLCAFVPPLRAQCGNNDNLVGTKKNYAWQTHFTAVSRLGNHFMPSFGNGDSMTEPFWLTGGANPGFGSDGFHETWYIPRENLTNTAALSRFYSPTDVNHLDAWTSSVSGYSLEFTHGYPWTYQRSGTKPITRYLNFSIFDHRTWLNSATPSGYNVDAILSTANGAPRYGYERFGNLLDRCQTLAAAYDATNKLQTTNLKIEFNKIWGNAIGKITHLPTGRQIVDEDIGAMVQSTIFVSSTADDPGTCCLINPTEAGGVDSWNYGNTTRWTGSPILSTTAIGSSTRETVVKPVNFQGNVFNGNDQYSPLLWNGEFKKTVTAGYTAGSTAYADVIKIVFGAKLDNDAPAGMAAFYTSVGLNNTFWLWRDTISTAADLRIEERNLATNTFVRNLTVPAYFNGVWVCNADIGLPCSQHYGYVAYSATDSTLAYGIMRKDNTDAPHAFKLMNWCNGGNATCTSGRPELIFDYYQNRGLSSASYQNETAFLVVGTPSEVRTRLRQIYCQETGACVP